MSSLLKGKYVGGVGVNKVRYLVSVFSILLTKYECLDWQTHVECFRSVSVVKLVSTIAYGGVWLEMENINCNEYEIKQMK